MRKSFAILFVLALAIVSIFLIQQTPATQSSRPTDTQQGSMKPSDTDKSFVMKAAMGGMTEVELSQLALTQATNEDVKRFAQRMVDDHGKANQELKQLAESKGMQVPAMLDGDHKKTKDKMSKLSGAAFDREYMSMMMKDHQKAVELFEGQSKNGKDPELKSWADKTLPTLREHMQMARDVASKVGAKTSGSDSATKPPKNN
jgi:putative membrane protein